MGAVYNQFKAEKVADISGSIKDIMFVIDAVDSRAPLLSVVGEMKKVCTVSARGFMNLKEGYQEFKMMLIP